MGVRQRELYFEVMSIRDAYRKFLKRGSGGGGGGGIDGVPLCGKQLLLDAR